MIMKIEALIAAITALLTGLTTASVAVGKALKSKKTYKAEAEQANAKLAILAEIKKHIARLEIELKDLHEWLKSRNGGTAGGLKFEIVLNAVKIFCLANHFEYDENELEKIIKEEVEFTKTVNTAPSK